MKNNDEKWDSENPFERRSCYDCVFLKSALSWWCTNEKAIKERGTSIPGCIHCPHWGPNYQYIHDKWNPNITHRINRIGERSIISQKGILVLVAMLLIIILTALFMNQ